MKSGLHSKSVSITAQDRSQGFSPLSWLGGSVGAAFVHQDFAGLILGQGTDPGCGFNPWVGCV